MMDILNLGKQLFAEAGHGSLTTKTLNQIGRRLTDGKDQIAKLTEDEKNAFLHDLGKELDKLEKAAQQVESIFVKDLLDKMHASLPGGEKKSQMEEFAYDMMHQSISTDFSKTNAVGIAQMVFKDMSKALIGRAEAVARLAGSNLDRRS